MASIDGVNSRHILSSNAATTTLAENQGAIQEDSGLVFRSLNVDCKQEAILERNLEEQLTQYYKLLEDAPR